MKYLLLILIFSCQCETAKERTPDKTVINFNPDGSSQVINFYSDTVNLKPDGSKK